jgi:hypothetical protein
VYFYRGIYNVTGILGPIITMRTRIFVFSAIVGVLAVLTLSSLSSCTKTIVQTVDVIDTVHDTVSGPALIRFLSMLPDGSTISIRKTASGNDALFASATSYSTPLYLPVRPDTAVRYFLYLSSQFSVFDSIPVQSLAAGSINTYALFLDASTPPRILPAWGNDSVKLVAAPAGYCYLRFINGIQDYPPNAELYLDLDSIGNYVFPQPVHFGSIGNYTLVPIGNHAVMIQQPFASEALIAKNQSFEQGAYYTARAVGKESDQSANLFIDVEQ